MSKALFRTVVTVKNAPELINPGDNVIFMGSCFASNMGKLMSDARLPVLINPFGVLYNPISIAEAIYTLINNLTPGKSSLVYNNGLWHSFFHHGQFSNPDPGVVINQVSNATANGHRFLQDARFLILTFGTSYVYEHKNLQKVVANCHKFPEANFSRYILDPEHITVVYKDLIQKIRDFNPGINIILTVSPVRHLKDGAHGNQLSKAVLLLATEIIASQFERVWYFPAYEIVLDDLRDYRFYDDTMTAPNNAAIKYIWSLFMESTLSIESRYYFKEVQKVVRARGHRHSGHLTDQYRAFVEHTLELIDTLSSKYPRALLDDDRNYFADKYAALLT